MNWTESPPINKNQLRSAIEPENNKLKRRSELHLRNFAFVPYSY